MKHCDITNIDTNTCLKNPTWHYDAHGSTDVAHHQIKNMWIKRWWRGHEDLITEGSLEFFRLFKYERVTKHRTGNNCLYNPVSCINHPTCN